MIIKNNHNCTINVHVHTQQPEKQPVVINLKKLSDGFVMPRLHLGVCPVCRQARPDIDQQITDILNKANEQPPKAKPDSDTTT